jgi:hypothetical protein
LWIGEQPVSCVSTSTGEITGHMRKEHGIKSEATIKVETTKKAQKSAVCL